MGLAVRAGLTVPVARQEGREIAHPEESQCLLSR